VGDIDLSASNVESALLELKQDHPALYVCVCDETGSVRRHIHLFVNAELVQVGGRPGLRTPLKSGDVLSIWTAVSGG
jgi:molybdopterin synthase sulfur carrier subunit